MPANLGSLILKILQEEAAATASTHSATENSWLLPNHGGLASTTLHQLQRKMCTAPS
jgi:hypothetical protein